MRKSNRPRPASAPESRCTIDGASSPQGAALRRRQFVRRWRQPPAFSACCSQGPEPRWQEYDDAIRRNDLSAALQTLERSAEAAVSARSLGAGLPDGLPVPMAASSSEQAAVEVLPDLSDLPPALRTQSLKVLDAALTAKDLSLVGRAYSWLRSNGLIQHFGAVKLNSADQSKVVTPTLFKDAAGIDASKLSPKKWGTGTTSLQAVAVIAGTSFLVNNGVDIRFIVAVVLAVSLADAIYLGGTGLGQVMSLWPPYKRRIVVHEAGHVLNAYLLGCPVRGVILDALEAVRLGIRGQAGTQFWDGTLEQEFKDNRLTAGSIDRYCVVLFSGIAAEAVVYGEAEGGESDENLYKSVVSQLQPPWSPAKVSNQARWAVLQAYNLVKEHRAAHEAIITVLEQGGGMSAIAEAIEAALPPIKKRYS
eukprot:SM000313S11976  [mRNA]  locus=s313:25156:28676:- [translate_table: standard]